MNLQIFFEITTLSEYAPKDLSIYNDFGRSCSASNKWRSKWHFGISGGFCLEKYKKVHFCATMTGVQLIIFSSTAGPTENRPLGGLWLTF